jgi:hypothetical protein
MLWLVGLSGELGLELEMGGGTISGTGIGEFAHRFAKSLRE